MKKILLSTEERSDLIGSIEGLETSFGVESVSPSLESVMSLTELDLHSILDMTKFRQKYAKLLRERLKKQRLDSFCGCDPEESFPGEDCHGRKAEDEQKKRNIIVKSNSPNTFNLFIDDDRFFLMAMPEYFGTFTNLLMDIHKYEWNDESIVNIYIDLNYVAPTDLLFFGCNVLNVLDLIPAKKVFKMNCLCDLVGLIFAGKCDKIDVAEMAAVNIHSGVENKYLSGVLRDSYIAFISEELERLKVKGLLTEEEITSMFEATAKVAIFLDSTTIKQRMNIS